ncbi:hypothetical protein MC7420_6139 [Coleofasciculus chthonoplastes PCC 7420]|uniref:Uncharacterized protein n=1 Tax=Coleofasciculus chthonoplastes PCC 7420 TaxID=118168 RepID=B4VTR3_9CYAN|nr:hypothetical protein MC7420_6139 [Coleofasciculus chthonoplastes PCC 7420]
MGATLSNSYFVIGSPRQALRWFLDLSQRVRLFLSWKQE